MRTILAVTLLTGALAAHASAAPIFGTFTIDGSVTVSLNTITWLSDAAVADQATIAPTGLTGSFVGMGGQTVGINDLNRTNQPINSNFTNFDFIDFTGMPGYPSLDANFIPLGAFGSADCTNPTPAAGQTCTPNVTGGSPFSFTNTSNGLGGINSSATWDISGVTSDGLGMWSAVFTAQFTTPFQDVLTSFGSVGFVTNSYSAAADVTISQVPEPATMALMGAGLVLISAGFRRFGKKRSK